MKAPIIISILSLALSSCTSNHRAQEPTQKETPKALDNNKSLSSEISYASKRSSDDLVDDLYAELVEKTPELKQLENQIGALARSQGDSTSSFHDFNAKNDSYYSSAETHLVQIQDSALRDKIKTLIRADMAKYKASISGHEGILHTIETKNVTVADLHKVIKIITTLAVMDKYQKDNLPSTKPLEGFLKQINQTIRLGDSLTKK